MSKVTCCKVQSFRDPVTGGVYWYVYDEHRVWMCWVEGSVHDVTAILREERWCFNCLTNTWLRWRPLRTDFLLIKELERFAFVFLPWYDDLQNTPRYVGFHKIWSYDGAVTGFGDLPNIESGLAHASLRRCFMHAKPGRMWT